MQDYDEAPYLELEEYKAPKGIKSIFVNMPDGKKLRLIYWKISQEGNKTKGTILLQQGHNEFIEKYSNTSNSSFIFIFGTSYRLIRFTPNK